MVQSTVQIHDRDEIARQRFEARQREFLRTLITPEVIEEHRISPQGQHSEPLDRLLIYFNRRPLAERYALLSVEPFKSYRIVTLAGRRGGLPRALDEKTYPSLMEAQHAIFLRSIQDLLES